MHEFDAIQRGHLYYVSTGEGFINPMDPTQIAARQIHELPPDSHLSPKPKQRMLVFRNGETNPRDAVRVVATTMPEVCCSGWMGAAHVVRDDSLGTRGVYAQVEAGSVRATHLHHARKANHEPCQAKGQRCACNRHLGRAIQAPRCVKLRIYLF